MGSPWLTLICDAKPLIRSCCELDAKSSQPGVPGFWFSIWIGLSVSAALTRLLARPPKSAASDTSRIASKRPRLSAERRIPNRAILPPVSARAYYLKGQSERQKTRPYHFLDIELLLDTLDLK